MMKDLEMLLGKAEKNADFFRDMLADKFDEFLDENNMEPFEILDVCGIDEDEFNDFLDGTGDIGFLAINDLVTIIGGNEIDDIDKFIEARRKASEYVAPASPLHSPLSPEGYVARPQFDAPTGLFRGGNEEESKEPEPTEEPVVQFPRDSRGRFVRRNVEPAPVSKFSDLSDNELDELILGNIWDSEIDLKNSTRNEKIKFLDEKEKILNMRRDDPRTEKEDKPEQPEDALDAFLTFLSNVAEEAKKNPDFAKAVSMILPKSN